MPSKPHINSLTGKVLVMTKPALMKPNTTYALGGHCSSKRPRKNDSFEKHIEEYFSRRSMASCNEKSGGVRDVKDGPE
jgi:hypothetical protein